MKKQVPASGKPTRPAPRKQEAREACRTLIRLLRGCPCLAQGSINNLAPKTDQARVTHTWTRKVRAKTVTVPLSAEQAGAFRRAIAVNRAVEKALADLRSAGQEALMSHLHDAPATRASRPMGAMRPRIPNGLK